MTDKFKLHNKSFEIFSSGILNLVLIFFEIAEIAGSMKSKPIQSNFRREIRR